MRECWKAVLAIALLAWSGSVSATGQAKVAAPGGTPLPAAATSGGAAPQAAAASQAAAAPVPPAQPMVPVDASLEAAQALVGKALFLRGFYGANEIAFTDAGKAEGSPKLVDWTLAAVNVLKAERHGKDEIELQGVRAAIRYNPDAREFQRHPLNDVKMKLLVKVAGDSERSARQIRQTFDAMFSVGIDPALQRSMPQYWRHYFDPGAAWPADSLAGVTAYPMFGGPDQPKDVTPPVLTKRSEAEFTESAARDRVRGVVQLRMVVDAEGVPRRIAVVKPLGYGLDERAVESATKWRFTPATRAGVPVAVGTLVNLDFETAPGPPGK